MKSISFSYIFIFAFLGVYSSLVSLHFSNLNFSGHQIANIFSIIPAISFFFNLIWGRIADNYNLLKKLNILLPLFGAIGYAITIYINTYSAYLALAVITGVIINPLFALSDSITISYCKKHNASFGNLRQWGTIAFSAINFFMYLFFKMNPQFKPLLVEENIHSLLYLMPILLFLRFISSLSLPEQNLKEEKLSFKQFFKLMSNKPLLLFFLACMFHSMASVSNYVYLSPYLKTIGCDLSFITACWALSPLLEVLVFRYSKHILNNISLQTLFRISVLCAALRWVILATTENQPIILLSQLLHTFGFGTYFLAAIHVLMYNIPEKVRSSGQGFFTAFTGMLGLIISNQILGQVTEYFPLVFVFYVSVIFSLIAYLVSLLIPKGFWNGKLIE